MQKQSMQKLCVTLCMQVFRKRKRHYTYTILCPLPDDMFVGIHVERQTPQRLLKVE